ncbi:hypothetical protein [Leptothoe sp. PORK10 BA2]|uniref:hypothetical protein n=1 Tax=Leptothoe sp. PORK10 BA2 TaxID=3110254 RepID=UPI002B1FEBF9|nr:hypothetical protein [Leptothoe sp. PORK10 BA2]MEA5462503.1 hypothetical protein [Leptothoe sp. PORK10 BA2]
MILTGGLAIATTACTQATLPASPSHTASNPVPTPDDALTPGAPEPAADPEVPSEPLFSEATTADAPKQQVPFPGEIEFSESELSLGGIRPGDDEATVLAELDFLGQPNHIVEDPVERRFEYTDFTVYFYDGRVIEIYSTNSIHCTPSGVCPNMKFERARARYGDPVVVDREDGQYLEYYPSEAGSCWLKIDVDDEDKMASLTIECQP